MQAAGPDFDAAAPDARSRGTSVRALVASDVRLYREGLAACSPDGFESSAPLPTARRPSRAARIEPDVVLVDLAMAGCETVRAVAGGKAAAWSCSACARSRTTWSPAPRRESRATSRVRPSLDELVDVVESVARGESLCSPRISALLLRRVAEAADRGHEAPGRRGSRRARPRSSRLIDEGLSNKQIAGRLSIELATVKNHVHSILEKLEVERRAEAAARVRSRED